MTYYRDYSSVSTTNTNSSPSPPSHQQHPTTATMTAPVHISSKEQFQSILNSSTFVVADCETSPPFHAPSPPDPSPTRFLSSYELRVTDIYHEII
jgi:hypothetical protein